MATLSNANRIVVKVGTSTLTYSTGKTNIRRMAKLVSVLSDLKNAGREIVLVSSGAIAVGVGKLGLKQPPQDTRGRQAAASVGQTELMFLYDKLFSEYGHVVGQMLLTRGDVDDPDRRQHLINTFEQLLCFDAIPIINENDSVAVEEIVFGDNDSLSAVVAKLVHADALVILTDTDGLYEGDPRENPEAMLIPLVRDITPELKKLAGGSGTQRGTGGMVTKLIAAEIAVEAGIDTVILNGENPTDLYKLLDGRQIGTWFVKKQPPSAEE